MEAEKEGLRPMILSDVKAVHAIETAVFATPWSLSSLIQEVQSNKAARYLVLQKDGEIVAYGGMWLVFDEAHITNIAVSPAHQRKGYGRKLTQGLLQLAKDSGMRLVTLEVRRSNAGAQALYHALGFVDVGYRKRYYTDNQEDALIMYQEIRQE